MSVQPNEPQGPNPEEQQNGHPAWQEVLDALPDDLQPLIRPKLEDWDKRQQDKVQGLHQQYDPYKKLVENQIPVDLVEQALYLHNMLETNPKDLVAKAIEHYGLEYIPKDQAQQVSSEDLDDLDDFDGVDITKHPAFQKLAEQLESVNSTLTAQQQREQQEAEEAELDNYLEELEKKHGSFNKLMVATLIANGMDGDQAVDTYKDEIAKAVQEALGNNQQQQNNPPPVVMGGDGTTGSGLPAQTTRMGDLKKNELNDLVMQFLEQNKSES